MKKTVVVLALLAAGVVHAEDVVIKIGSSNPLTGAQAHLGKDSENGVRLAIEDYNAKKISIGGKTAKFELVSEDDQAVPEQGRAAAQRLVDAGVKAVIGHMNSGTTLPGSEVYDKAGLVMISPSATNVKVTDRGMKGVFRVMANDAQQGSVLGGFAATKLGKSVAIIDDRTAYGQGLADQVDKAVKKSKGKVVAREFTTDKANDFLSQLTKIKGLKPDVIFYGGMDTQAGPMLKQMKQLGITAKFLAGDGGCTAQMFELAAGAIGEQAYCSEPGVPIDSMPGGKSFAERYKKRFNTDIQLYAPYAYDATVAVIEAMKAANSAEPAKFLPALKKTSIPGVTSAKITFDDKGDIKGGSITLKQAKGGKWTPIN